MKRALGLLLLAACAAPTPLRRGLDADVHAIVRDLGTNVRAAVWLSAPTGPPAYALHVDAPMPTASAIKAAYLIELFAEFADDLDAPFPDLDKLLTDAAHPAVRDFPAVERATARRALANASVRTLGEIMIQGKGVDNATYNLAANLVTAHFGGPTWLDARLHQRDPAWQDLHVRRYMLADRTTTGDNEATATSLAAVHALLARGHIDGIPDTTVKAAREVLRRPDDATGLHRYCKTGALDSEPVTRVDAGFVEGPDGVWVYVVMLAQDGIAAAERAGAGQRLGGAVEKIQTLLLAAVP